MCLFATTPPEQVVPSASSRGTAQLLMSQRPHWLLPMQTTAPGLEQVTAPSLQLPVETLLLLELELEPASAGAGGLALESGGEPEPSDGAETGACGAP